MRHLIVGAVAAMLAACGTEPEVESTAPSSDSADAIQIEVRTARITEGTNMAAVVNPMDRTRYISLQGRLFQISNEGDAKPLTDAYFDVREPQLSSDGTKIAFHGYRSGNWDIWEHDLATGETQQITNDQFDDREPQYTDQGVVFSSDRGGSYDVWSFVDGEFVQLTGTKGNAYSPTMHDGKLAYVLNESGMSHVIADRQNVVSHPGTISGLQWSPSGDRLSYQLLGAAGSELRIVSLGGEDQVISRPGEDVFPFRATWLSENTLAYTSDGLIKEIELGGEASNWPFLVELKLERHNYQRRIRDYDSENDRQALGLAYPVIDSSGDQIYFTALGDIWSYQPSNQSLTQLTDDGFAENGLALNAAGTSLAYVGESLNGVDLRVMDLGTGEVRVLEVEAQSLSMPTWSPDGASVATFVDVPGNPLGGQLVVINVETGEQSRILGPMPAQPISWDETGQHVAVTRLNPYSTRYREGMYELVIASVDNSEVTAIHPVPHKSISHASLKDSTSMTYVEGGVLYELELLDNFEPAEKGVQLTNDVTDFPAWSANGEYLVYLSGDRLNLYSQADGTSRDVTPTLLYKYAAPNETYVLRAGRVFTGQGDSYLENQDIVIAGATIESMGPADPSVEPDVDASDYTVTPGLFEMHAHMGETSEQQGRVWLAYGITTVRDPGSNPYVAKQRQEAWDSGRRIGPRTHVTGFLTDGNRVYYSMAEGIVSDDHLQMALDRSEALKLDFIKTYVRLPDHWQKTVVDFAHRHGMPVSSHELYPAVAHGMDHVEHIGGTSRRGYQPKVSRLGYSYQDVVELLSVGGMGMTATAVLPGFAVIVKEEPDWFENPQFDFFYGPGARRGYEALLQRFGGGAASVAKANGGLLRALTERDALLVTGTDAPFVPYGAGLHAEFRLYQRAGVTPAQILHQATVKSAKASGVGDELGQIEAGRLADLVIVDGDPLANIGDMDNVVMTIKHGQRYNLDDLLR